MDVAPPAPDTTGKSAESGPSDHAGDLTRLAVIAGELDAVEVALRRLDDGSYWACEVCGAAIDAGVAVVDPLGRRCGAHRRDAPPV